MSDYKDLFRSAESQNWFKCCLAVLIAREGLVEFVKNETDTFLHDSLQKVYQVNNVPQGTQCMSCSTHSVLPCRPNGGTCQIRRGRCKFHTSLQRPCPNNICDFLRQEIENEHHFAGPSWKNSDCKGWCMNSWELAKCFMPPDGYSNIPSVEATDFNGIISVMINCKRFENKLDDDLSQAVNLCTQARDVGKSVRHCADLKMNTVSMAQNISTLIDLLGDAKYLKNDAKASEAMLKLTKLKTDSLAITTVDVKAALDSLQDEITKSATDELQLSADKTQQTIEQSMSKKLQEVIERMEEMELETKRKMAESEKQHLDNLKHAGEGAVSNFKMEINNEIVTAKDELNTEKDRLVAVMGMQQNETAEANEVYEKRKHALRQALSKHYLTSQGTMPLCPLMPEVDEQLNTFYVPFKMKKVDTTSTTKFPQAPQTLNTYESIFYDGKKCPYRNIYIQGDAGIGKTTFCTKLALLWSENISKEISTNDSSSNQLTVEPKHNERQVFSDESILKEFDFVFSLVLRDVSGECELEKMIETMIISELPDHSKYAGLVPTILDKEHCLVILDGLDEWSNQRKDCKKSRLVPHVKSWSRTTVLTTTRPWKMNEVRLKDSEISILIHIIGITGSETFSRNVMKCLNEKYNSTLDVRDFFKYTKVKNVEHCLEIPIVSMHLLWLWHSGHELGDSHCQIYMNMLAMLFERAQDKTNSVSNEDEDADIPQSGLPSCFERTMYCQQHKMLLDCLCCLAFHTLHSSQKEESLIFSDSIVKRHVKSTAAVTTSLTTGILSQHKSPSRTARCSHFSFLHKTFQEFFAAYYVATRLDESENVVKTLCQVYGQTVDIMDISELFIFVCGMNTEMACKISESVVKSFSVKLINTIEELPVSGDNYTVEGMAKSLQEMILAGYKELISNGHQDPELALHHLCYHGDISDVDKIHRDRLLDMNIDKIVTLGAERCTVDVVKIQQILTQSSSKLSHVCLWRVDGLAGAFLDLFTNITLKSLLLSGINTHFDIKINTSSLLYCHLCEINKEVEYSVLSALTAAPQLHTLEVRYCENMSALCKVLPTLPTLHRLELFVYDNITIPDSLSQTLSTLSHLQRLTVRGHYADPSLLCQNLSTLTTVQSIKLVSTCLGDNDILLPSFIQEIELRFVKLTCRSFRQLVDRVKQIQHEVACTLWRCTVIPREEYETIVMHIQQSDLFEIHRNYIYSSGAQCLHFTKIQT